MTPAPTASLGLLEECLLRINDSDAWTAFLEGHSGLWRYLCANTDWSGWLPGWLVARRRLEQAWQAVTAYRQLHPDASACDVEGYLQNYLGLVFRAGAAEFHQEMRRPWTPEGWQWNNLPAPEDRPLLPEMPQLETWLAEEPQSRRVPFRLRYCRALGRLDSDDRTWLAGQAGIPVATLDDQLRNEMDSHPDHQYPISAHVIAALMGISTNLVDQRVRQVLLQLRQRFLKDEEL